MKILSVADIHINLYKKKVPYLWQHSRFKQLFNSILELEKTVDIVILAGDIFDKAPQLDEIALFLAYTTNVNKPTYIIDGNHEASSRGKTFLSHFAEENVIKNPNINIITKNTNIIFQNQVFQFFPYNELSIDNQPEYIKDSILVTHIRCDIPPFITEEYDFEKLRPWKLILLGDIHVNMQYKDYPAHYPGSPINTTFDRDINRQYGVDIFDFQSISNYSKTFVDLGLPKLIRKTVTSEKEMIADTYNHTIYEITGSIDELAKIGKSELLDKKLVERPNAESTLDLVDKNIYEELEIYLRYKKVTDVTSVINEFKNIHIEVE